MPSGIPTPPARLSSRCSSSARSSAGRSWSPRSSWSTARGGRPARLPAALPHGAQAAGHLPEPRVLSRLARLRGLPRRLPRADVPPARHDRDRRHLLHARWPRPTASRPSAMNAVRSAMEREVGEQALKLEDRMTVLATAVSGAPFLGLLGTVWGVMDTFSAIAAGGHRRPHHHGAGRLGRADHDRHRPARRHPCDVRLQFSRRHHARHDRRARQFRRRNSPPRSITATSTPVARVPR